VAEALTGALERAHARIAEGIAEAERELVIARERCKELQREMAIAKARAGHELEVPERILIPDLDLATLEVGWPEPEPETEVGTLPMAAGTSPPTPAEPAHDAVVASDATDADSVRELTCATLPPEWRHSLTALVRCDVAMFPEVFAHNVILRWEGENPLAGTHLGDKQAQPVLARLAASIQPGSALVEDLRETDGNVEATVLLTFVGDIPDHVELTTRLRCVFRFDDAGRIALFFATPEELDVVDGFLILVEEGDPDADRPATP
jgi:ketosteroid isomerase-like protein